MREIDTGTLIQSADFWKDRWEASGSQEDLEAYRQADQLLREVTPPQWRNEWNQIKAFRDMISREFLSYGMSLESAVFFADHFTESAQRRMEDDPKDALEYMRKVSQFAHGKTGDNR